MQPVFQFPELYDRLNGQPSAVTIGVFDGVHLGHQALISETVSQARENGAAAVAITFSNHPLSVLAPPYSPRSLLTSEEKTRLLFEAGIDHVLLLEFTPAFAAISPEAFVRRDLLMHANLKNLVCGYDFTFGCRGAGNLDMLKGLGAELDFSIKCVGPVSVGNSIVKSTRIRDLLSEGEVAGAAELLTRPHQVPGTVVQGYQRGRTIGIPTANLEPPANYQWPAMGVYACGAELPGSAGLKAAMVNIGTNPTFGSEKTTMEAHLLDFDGELVGQRLTLHFLERLRSEQKFPGVDALKAQLAEDRVQAKQVWQTQKWLGVAAD